MNGDDVREIVREVARAVVHTSLVPLFGWFNAVPLFAIYVMWLVAAAGAMWHAYVATRSNVKVKHKRKRARR